MLPQMPRMSMSVEQQNQFFEEKQREFAESHAQRVSLINPINIPADDTPEDIKHKQNAHGQGTCLAMSPMGNIVATGGADGQVKLWNLDKGTGTPEKIYRQLNSAPSSISFNLDGKLMAFSSTTKQDTFAIRLVSTTRKNASKELFTGHSDTVN